MKRVFVLLTVAFFAAMPVFGQQEDKEGKAWLASCAGTDAASLNATGLWKSEKWGVVSLNQHKDSPDIIGSGDGWDITGLTAGKNVCLLFSSKGEISYTAKLTEDGTGQLSGAYAKELISPKSKMTSMTLTKINK